MNINQPQVTYIYQKDINESYVITKPGIYKLGENIVHEFFEEKEIEGNRTRQLIDDIAIRITKKDCNYGHIFTKNEYIIKSGQYGKHEKYVQIGKYIYFPVNFEYLEGNNKYYKINPNFIGGANARKQTAAIKIGSDNVIFDLNGYSISQSKRFACEQRVYSVIEINRLMFLNSGRGFQPGPKVEQPGITNVSIINGTIGRSSHFGIHGTNSSSIKMENLIIRDFEVSGIWINNGQQITINNCKIQGLIHYPQPVMELRAFKTTGTGETGIVDSNLWGIFLNDSATKIQRTLAPHSRDLLLTGPPNDGVEKSEGGSRRLVGPRASTIRNTNIGELKSRVFQAGIIARRNKNGMFVPVLFSINQHAHSGFVAAPKYSVLAVEDGYASYKNKYNPIYTELNDAVYITQKGEYAGIILVNKLEKKKLVNETYLDDTGEMENIDSFYINENNDLCINHAVNQTIKNVIIKNGNWKNISNGTLISPKWNENNRRINQVITVEPHDIESRYKVSSRDFRKDLNKNPNGKYPILKIPNSNEEDINDRLESTFFENQLNEHENTSFPKPFLVFDLVEDNFAVNDLRFHANQNIYDPHIIHFDENGEIEKKSNINNDGIPYVPYDGSYIRIQLGHSSGLKKEHRDTCQQPDDNFKTLASKLVYTIPLVNKMLNGRELTFKEGGQDTDPENGIDGGGHNMIGVFGLQLEASKGCVYENLEIVGSMNIDGRGKLGRNAWGLIASDSEGNVFKNILVSNMVGTSGDTIGFHLTNGSRGNVIENCVVSGISNPMRAHGYIIDNASEGNCLNNCKSLSIVGGNCSKGYSIRGRGNTLQNCLASRIKLLIQNNLINLDQGIVAGFSFDTNKDNENFTAGNNKCINCDINGISVYGENEINSQLKLVDLTDKEIVPMNKYIYDTISSGIFISNQDNNIIKDSTIDNVRGWGEVGGIFLYNKGSGHIIENNTVRNITTLFPGYDTKVYGIGHNKDIQSNTLIIQNKVYNSFNYWTKISNNYGFSSLNQLNESFIHEGKSLNNEKEIFIKQKKQYENLSKNILNRTLNLNKTIKFENKISNELFQKIKIDQDQDKQINNENNNKQINNHITDTDSNNSNNSNNSKNSTSSAGSKSIDSDIDNLFNNTEYIENVKDTVSKLIIKETKKERN